MKAILSILSSVFWLIVRIFKRRDDPQRQYERNRNENAKIIADGDADSLNRKLDAGVNRLPIAKGGSDSE